ncbi:MAG: helix-turn-helix domain-containing protein [Clostridiales bacterium]|nr:helix-turn-helix domain-containing protein [Clostridiales bacterium]
MYPRIRALREDRDLNQTTVARLLHMSQTGYSKYETGENDLPTNILIQLAQYYQTSIDYLLGLTDQIEPYPRGDVQRRKAEQCH